MLGPSAIVTLALFALRSYGAQTTLYVPGFDPQPLSVDYITTDSKSHTVWALHATGDAASNIDSIPGVFTLVEGSDYASLGYSNTQISMSFNEECTLASNTALCTVTDSDGVRTDTDSSITKLTATIGTPPPVTTTPSPSSPTSRSSSAPGASLTSVTSTASTASPSNSTHSNSARGVKEAYGSKAVYILTTALFLFVAL